MQKFKKPIYVTSPIFPPIEKYYARVKEIWGSKWLSNNGKQCQEFESKLAEHFNTKNISIFNNGTIALMSVIKMLNLKGEVITTPFTFAATPNCITWNQLKPVFCDIKEDTLCIDADKVEALITSETSAILAVHVFGNPCDVEQLERIAKKHNLKLIFDGAHAFDLKIKNKNIFEFGDATMFSFHPTKLFHSAEGGAVITKNYDLKKSLDLWKNFGIANEIDVLLPGLNGKMNELQAAMGILVLDEITSERVERKRVQNLYQKHLKGIAGVSFHIPEFEITQSLQYFVIKINEAEFGMSRDQVYEEMKNYNVFTRKYFYPLCSNYPYYKDLPSSHVDNLPVANKIVEEVLSLPFFGKLSDADVKNICEIIKTLKTN